MGIFSRARTTRVIASALLGLSWSSLGPVRCVPLAAPVSPADSKGRLVVRTFGPREEF